MYIFLNHMMVALDKSDRKDLLRLAQNVSDTFEAILTSGIRQGEFKPHNARVLAQNITVSGNSWTTRQWFWRKQFTLDQYIKEQTDLVLKAISIREIGDRLIASPSLS
jgi:hypothetical protein